MELLRSWWILWLPRLKGSTTFPPPPGGGSDIAIDAEDILENLKWGAVVAKWRYLSYDLGGAIDGLAFNGPAVAVNFRW